MIPKWTLPAIDGARVATDTLIRNSILAGMEIDILCFPQAHEKTDSLSMKEAWGVKNIHIIPRDLPEKPQEKVLYYLKNFMKRPWLPLTFSSFMQKRILKETQNILSHGTYDFVVLDGLHLGIPFLQNQDRPKTKIIYRAHNIEADLWFHAAVKKKNLLLKTILYLQGHLVDRTEKKILSQCAGVAAIAQEDFHFYKTQGAPTPTLVPVGLNFDRPLDSIRGERTKFLFIGRLDWPPNKDGLLWLLKEVWPEVMKRRPDAILKIVGSGESSWLKEFKNLPGVEFVGFVPSVDEAYQDSSFTLVPVFYGSGTRIKVLESFAKGRKLISTKMGIQGAGITSDDYLEAETAEEWIELLSTVKLDAQIEEGLHQSRARVSAQFGEREVGEQFHSWLKTL